MQHHARVKFEQYCQQLGTLNGVTVRVGEAFTVSPTVQQTLETKLQDTSSFLQAINVLGVTPQTGQKVFVGVSGPTISTTDTSSTDRNPRDVSSSDNSTYFCTKTDFDTAINYSLLDAWAHRSDFQVRLRDSILQRQALDRIMVGFNGASRAATSNLSTHPLGQDVNKGWLQHIREDAAAQVMDEGVASSGRIKVGGISGNDYKNLDALVFDAINTFIHPAFQENPNLVAITSRAMLADKYFPLLNQDQTNENKLAADMIISQKRMGGLQVVGVPYFPAGKILITTLANLSLYWQIGGRRRTIFDNARRDRIENFESSNDAYVIELYEAACLLENIVLPTDGDVWPYTVTGVTLSPGSLSLTAGGATATVTATVAGTNSPPQGVIWASSNPAKATVDEDGVVTPVAAGTAIIVATSVADPSHAAQITCTVAAP